MLAVAAYPILYAFWLSLNKADLRTPDANEFIWFGNYVTVLSSPIWWTAFGVTMFITIVGASLELVLGMVLAIVMHRTIVGRGLVRTSALVPYAIVTVVAAFSWRFAWTQGLGLAGRRQRATDRVVALDLDHHPGRGLEDVPFMALLLMAGLALVPEDLLKAASMDGATAWQRFWRITVPLIKPAILVALLFRTLDAFRVFDNIYVLTSGANKTALGVDRRLQQPDPRAQPRHRLDDGGADLPHHRDHRVHLHQALRCGGTRSDREGAVAVQTETPQRKLGWWGVNIIVLLYAFIPVVWIISLSLKDAGTLNDGKYLPDDADRRRLHGDLQEPRLHPGADQLDRHLPDLDVRRARARHDGGLRHRPAGLPGQDDDRRRWRC